MFENIFRMQSVNGRTAALFYGSVVRALKVRPVVCRKNGDSIVGLVQLELRGIKNYDVFFIISKTNLSLSWLENRLVWARSEKF